MKTRNGVSSAVFAGTAIVLLIFAGVGFSLYLTSPHNYSTTEFMTETTTMQPNTETTTMSNTEMTTTTDLMTVTTMISPTPSGYAAIQFVSMGGQMISNAWLLIEPTESGQYAVSIFAQGLEDTQSMHSAYLVEGAESSASMSVVPIGPNVTSSEFGTTSNGQGSYFILLNQNPYANFESFELVYLPSMSMSNATVVATASLTMMLH